MEAERFLGFEPVRRCASGKEERFQLEDAGRPMPDGRLKENRESGADRGSSSSSGHATGAVKDPKHDGRLRA